MNSTDKKNINGGGGGENPVTAFLMKFDVRKVQPVWTRQLGAMPSSHKVTVAVAAARGMACAAPDGKSVWWAGSVSEESVIHDGSLIFSCSSSSATSQKQHQQHPQNSHGGQDLFLARMNTETGQMQLIQQMGSSMDDELAAHGGLVMDAAGKAVLVGSTYGSFYRTRAPGESSSDVFVFTVPLRGGPQMTPLVGTDASDEWRTFFVVFVWSFVGCFTTTALLITHHYRRKQNVAATERSHVSSYLSEFDIEDVELKHSASGGWHCNFVNRLAEGKDTCQPRFLSSSEGPSINQLSSGRKSGSDLLMRVSRTGNLSKDVLFSRATEDATGYLDISNISRNGQLHGGYTGSAYGDLIDAYNSTWSSLPSSLASNACARQLYSGIPSHDGDKTIWDKVIL